MLDSAVKRGPGRPKNTVPGTERWILEHSGEYNSARKSKASQTTIGKLADRYTFLFIAHWGWDQPLRRATPVRQQATPSELEAVKVTAFIAEDAIKTAAAAIEQSMSVDSVLRDQDQTVKQVRLVRLPVYPLDQHTLTSFIGDFESLAYKLRQVVQPSEGGTSHEDYSRNGRFLQDTLRDSTS